MIIGVGSDTYAPIRSHALGEFCNVTIRNLTTCAQEVLQICEPCENVRIENVSVFGKSLIGATFAKNFLAKNMTIRNFDFVTEEEADSLSVARCGEEAFDGLQFGNVRVGALKSVFRGTRFSIDNLQVTATPSEGDFTETIPAFPHPYGRYHRYFHDVPIANRPSDTRWANECYDI